MLKVHIGAAESVYTSADVELVPFSFLAFGSRLIAPNFIVIFIIIWMRVVSIRVLVRSFVVNPTQWSNA